MAKVVVTITTKPQDFPAGVQAGNMRVTISNGMTQDINGLSATFADVPPGDYIVKAQLLDVSNNLLGTEVAASFTVPVPVNTLQVPDTLSVTVG